MENFPLASLLRNKNGYSRFLCVTSSFAKGCWSPISKQMERSGIESHPLMHPVFPRTYSFKDICRGAYIFLISFLSKPLWVAAQKRTKVLRHMPEPSQETYTL